MRWWNLALIRREDLNLQIKCGSGLRANSESCASWDVGIVFTCHSKRNVTDYHLLSGTSSKSLPCDNVRVSCWPDLNLEAEDDCPYKAEDHPRVAVHNVLRAYIFQPDLTNSF
jgi:hypothetical protein